MKCKQAAMVMAGMAALCGAACGAQSSAAGQPQATARAAKQEGPEFDIGVGFYEAFNNGTMGNGTQQTTTNAVGGMLEGRLLLAPLVGVEITYSHNTADQTFKPTATNCGYACQNPVTALHAQANEVGIDYVASKKMGILRPFAVGGLGFFITSPAKSTYEVDTVVRPAYIFGGGVDVAAASHLGVRVQFRDSVYKSPNLSAFYPATGMYTHTAEPIGGVYYNF